MIITEGLTRKFKDLVAVEGLDLEVEEGEVFGFLGPNGAGKTTTVRMLAALIAPTSGRAVVAGYQLGKENQKIREVVGVLTESPGLYGRLSAYQNLEFFARLYGVRARAGQVEKYLRMLDLWDRRDEPVGRFSKGLQQKVALARALIHEPRVLFLDEPTAGLDPEAAKLVRDFIEELAKEERRTIFLCTHNLSEAERLCDRIGLIKQRLIKVGTPEELKGELYGRRTVIQLKSLPPAVEAEIGRLPFVEGLQADGNKLILTLAQPESQNPLIVRRLVELGGEVQWVQKMEHTLEEVYLDLVKEGE
ncbi:MAG: ABC transporter ATP-binding protein [Candidatus Acetothermia bacterium]|jgi:ABC-2 type transport system ATP-binding protein|nr:ABC transporter ATP-binding protein [Candidatus Acetothermia bacterium]MDH7505773.1 ABC transporter ATP-binding protein [Candidatus Acetothermia bacterium]